MAILYNKKQPYIRRKLSERGDYCDWFAIRSDIVLDAIQHTDPGAHERPERPFAQDLCRGAARPFTCTQRRLLHYVQHTEAPDSLLVEVNVLHLLETLMSQNAPTQPARRRRRLRDLPEAARRYLAKRFRERVTLSGLSKGVGCTEFHLSHAFRRRTGITLHAYLTQLRLRAALERIAEQCPGF